MSCAADNSVFYRFEMSVYVSGSISWFLFIKRTSFQAVTKFIIENGNAFHLPYILFDWVLKAQNRDIFDYIRGLIALRKAHPAFRIPTVEGLEQWLHFLDTGDSGIIAYTLGEYANGDMWKEILVAYNGNRNEAGIHLPEQDWIVVCKDGQINLDSQEHLPGGDVSIAASSALILYRN